MIQRPIRTSLLAVVLLLFAWPPASALAEDHGAAEMAASNGDAAEAGEADESRKADKGFAWEASTEVDHGDELKRWVPSFALASGILVDSSEGSVSSNVRDSASGSADFVSPWVIGSFEVMTPQLLDVPGRPRLFVHGDTGILIGTEKDLAKEGDPSQAFEPPTQIDGSLTPIGNDELILGQGSATRAQPRKLSLTAGAGVAFTWDLFGRPIRTKTSVEYLREEVRVSGIVKRAALIPPLPTTNFLFITLQDQTDAVFHGIGPGLEVETDLTRWRSLLVGLGVSAQYYWIMSDRDVRLADSQDIGLGTADAVWDYKRGLHAFRMGVHMRFRWAPLD